MSSKREVIKVKRGNRLDGALPRLSDYMKKWANKLPDHVAFIYHDVPISYRQLNKNVQQLAKYMLKMGVKKGDRLGYIMNGRPEFFTFYLAASMVGAVIVGMNTRHTAHEIAYILSNCEVAMYCACMAAGCALLSGAARGGITNVLSGAGLGRGTGQIA